MLIWKDATWRPARSADEARAARAAAISVTSVSAPQPATPLDHAIAQVLRDALKPYPEGSAKFTCKVEYSDRADMYFTEVEPTNPGAAPLSLAYDGCWGGDTLHVTVGRTSFEVFPFVSDEDLPYLRQLVEAILAGRVEEVARGDSSFARILTDAGPVRVGGLSLPVPWRTRKARRHDAYGRDDSAADPPWRQA